MKKYINYTEYLKQQKRFNLMARNGLKPYYKRNYFKLISGIGLISLSFILPLDFGLFAVSGCYILGLSVFDIKNIYTPKITRLIKNKLRGLN